MTKLFFFISINFIVFNTVLAKNININEDLNLEFNCKLEKKIIKNSEYNYKTFLADELNVKPETITQMESRLSGNDVSYDPMEDDESSPSTYLTDSMDPSIKLETESESSDNISKLRQALLKLDDRSKDIIQQRYLLDNKSTLDDLSKKYNISKERVRQIENKSLDLIKDSILIA